MKKIACFFLSFFILTTTSAKALFAEGLNYRDIYKLRSPAVVLVMGLRNNGVGSVGTGSIINKDGLVITNAHVILDSATNRPYPNLFVYLKPDKIKGDRREDLDRRYDVKAIKYSNKLDLALLKIISPPRQLTTIPFANPDTVEIGDPVLAIGHPEQGGLWTLTTGVISTRIKNFENIKGKNVFQTETSFNKGNSGGPLINLKGDMVGINSNIARTGSSGITITDVNFSISSGVAKKWINETGFPLAYARPQKETKPESKKESKKVDLKLDRYPIIQPEEKSKQEPKQLPEERKKLWAEGTQLTPRRPYMPDDLMKVEDEMEDMLKDMRSKFR